MSFSDFLDMPMEPSLPDLLPEGSLFNSTFPPENPSITSTQQDIVVLSSRLDQLSLWSNWAGTQSLRIELEKHKRQKLRTTIRQIKQDMNSPCPDTVSLKYEFDIMQRNQDAINYNYQLEGEITTMITITFRCLSRVHQLVTRLLPHVMLAPDDNFELVQMLHELSQTLHQFQPYYSVSYV